jgi:DNA-binding SARP family transcriptional activator/LysM repeat protein
MNRPGTTRRLLAGLAAATSLTVLLVVVPAILAVLAGWPLPRTVPDIGQVKAVLGSRAELPSATLVKAVAVVGWIAWLEIALAIVAETTARLRGRTVPRLRLPGGSGAQLLAAHLVTGVLLLAGTRQAAPTPHPLTAVLTVASTSTAVPPAPEPTVASPTTVDYTVRPGDWLSTIARDQLGDLHRYPEIADLNMGRPQPDGRSLEDVDLIRPGWLLRLPSQPAVVPPAHSSPETAPASEEVTSLSASPGLEGASSAASPGTPEETPGTDQSPPVPATAAETPPVQPIPGPPSAPSTTTSGSGPEANDPEENPSVPWKAPTAVVPAVVAGLAINRLVKLRANQQRQRRRGRTIARPSPSLRDRETHIRAIADQEAPAWVDAATRRLWTALETIPPDDIPAVTAVRAGSLGVELLLDRVAPVPPPGFIAGDGGRTWRLDHHGDLAALAALIDGQSSALPGLLHLGDTPEGPLWLNLEQAGTLSIEGDPERVQAFIAAAAIHLSTAPWSDALNVLQVGGDPRLAVLDHVRVASQDEAVAAATTVPGPSARHRMATRITPPALEALAPTVVVAAPGSLDADATTALNTAAQPETGLVLIASGPIPEAAWRLVLSAEGGAVLEPLKIRLTHRSDVGTTDAVAALIAHGAEHEDIALPEPAAPPPPLQADQDEEGALPVRVRILGPVEIDWAGPTPRTKAAEIVAYLATRERPVPSGRLKLDLWPAPPGDEIAAATFRTNVSRARSALGTGPNGEHHLCDAEQGSYRLGPGITSDWQRFQQLVARARQASSDDAIELYREAIKLIRGAPFADAPKGAYHWIHGDGLIWEIETSVAEAAERFADLALDAGEHRLADWAARQALKVTPHREPLYQLRMKAAAQANDHDALERIYRELRLMVRSLGELEEPRPETVALYQALTGRPAERLTKAM